MWLLNCEALVVRCFNDTSTLPWSITLCMVLLFPKERWLDPALHAGTGRAGS